MKSNAREAQLTIRERVVYSEYLEGRAPDPHSLRAVQVARRYLQGQATREELETARHAAEIVFGRHYTDALQATLGRPSGLIGTPGYRPYNAAVTHAAYVAVQAIHDVDEERSITGIASRAIDQAAKAAGLAAGTADYQEAQGKARAALNAEFDA